MRLAYGVVIGFAAIAALGEHAARAGNVAARLDYVAAPTCPAASDFEAEVAKHLGYSPFQDDASEHVVIRIEPSGRGLEGRLEWRKENGGWAGERAFPSRTGDCAELVRAMGFALAVQFQLLATAESAGGTPAAPPGPPAPPIVAAPPPSAPPPASRSPGGPSMVAGAGASAGIGLAPDVTAVGRVFGSVAWPHVAVELAGEVTVPSTTRRADGAGFSHQVFLASLASCGLLSRWSGCALAKVGEVRVAGDGVDTPATSSGLILQTGLRLAVTQMLGQRAHIGAHADGVALLTRGVVTLDGMPVWTTPRIAATFGVDFGLKFR
jgi:hypothetical protein